MDLKVCRICGGMMRLKNILEEDNVMLNKLLVCVNIKIQSGDLLPKFICEQCDTNLDICYRLKQQCDSTQKRLMLAMQRNQNATGPDGENADEHSVCKKVDLPQCFGDSFESVKMDAHSKKEELLMHNTSIYQSNEQNTISEELKSADVSFESNNKFSCFDSDILTNKSESRYENELKELPEITIAAEYCSIDLLSSGSSSCYDCDDSINEKAEFKLTDESVFTCDTCQEVFTKNLDYRVHIKQHGIERYQCIQCCKSFPSRFRLKRHEETHQDIPSYQCSYCNRNYRALYNLNRHVRSAHLGKKSWECNLCNVSFSRLDTLKRHSLLHSDERQFRCSMCPQSFKTKDYLCAHHKTHHIKNSDTSKTNKNIKKDNGNKNQCGYCGKFFKSSFAFKNHVLIHSNEKPHKCETCNKAFRTIAALTIHQRIHDDYRPYQCDLCLKSFRQTSHLKEHKALHLENARNHVCSICKASFAKKGNLKAHILTHAKEKAFKCADCSAEFSFMHLLQRHASKDHFRSVQEEYTLTDVDDELETDDETKQDNVFQNEMYHYIDTVAEDNIVEFEENTNFVDLVSNEESNIETSSSELQVISLPQLEQQIFYDKNYASVCGKSAQENDGNHSINFLQIQPTKESMIEQIRDQKVDILVTEETKLTSTLLNVFGTE